jgi:hypothetical protein
VQSTDDGGVSLKIWDNNYPGRNQSYDLVIHPDGSWDYDAPYKVFKETHSFTATSSYPSGSLFALPLYTPSGLHFFPPVRDSIPSRDGNIAVNTLGAGLLFDVPSGDTVNYSADAQQYPAYTVPVLSGIPSIHPAQTVNLPSGRGSTQVFGSTRVIGIRSAQTFMTVEPNSAEVITMKANGSYGSIKTSGNTRELTISRQSEKILARGVTGLTFAPNGSVSTSGDGRHVFLSLSTYQDGSNRSTILFSGPTSRGGSIKLTRQQMQGILSIQSAKSAGWLSIYSLIFGIVFALIILATFLLSSRGRSDS